ncbi:hypothetical protein TrCOL_g2025 [Triparma columacea]|uniref:Uncharacterized protein n=1 Tax=Triparma columacea TaxID=722753 RepID=A0A9W7GCC2_9STRA|nr:hypothetical protein TrCOL_g2025 [Triparma columacea]
MKSLKNISTFPPPPGLPVDLKGHITHCSSPLALLDSRALIPFFTGAIESQVAYRKRVHTWIPLAGEAKFFVSGMRSKNTKFKSQAQKIFQWEGDIEDVVEKGVGEKTSDGIIVAAYIRLVVMLTTGHHVGYMWAKPNGPTDSHGPHQDSKSWFELSIGGIGGLEQQAKGIASVFLAPQGNISSSLTFTDGERGGAAVVYNLNKLHGAINFMDETAGGCNDSGVELPWDLFHRADASSYSHLTIIFIGTSALTQQDARKFKGSLRTVSDALFAKGIIGHPVGEGEKDWPKLSEDLPAMPKSVIIAMSASIGGKESTKTEPGKPKGVHEKKRGKGLSMSLSLRGQMKRGVKKGKGKTNSVGKGVGKSVGKGTAKSTLALRDLRKGFKWVCPGCGKTYAWNANKSQTKHERESECRQAILNSKTVSYYKGYKDRKGNPCKLPNMPTI